MFRQILFTQWKWARLLVLGAGVCAFAVPVMSVQSLSSDFTSWIDGQAVLRSMRAYGTLYAILATSTGAALAISAWSADHRGRHIYALALPIERWRFALMRFGAGALLLLVPAAALWVGALLATASVDIPPGLEAFPTSLALRFALASLLGFAMLFAIAAGTVRTAGWVLGGMAAIVVLALFGDALGISGSLADELHTVIFSWPGVLEVFTGRWMLIDV